MNDILVFFIICSDIRGLGNYLGEKGVEKMEIL